MMTVLIVDDSRMMRMKLRGIITGSGVPVGTILEANNGQEALEVVKAQAVDVLFTDINMPEMDGRQLLRALTDQQLATSAVKIVCTTEDLAGLKSEFESCGVSLYVEKPFQAEVVKQALSAVSARVAAKSA